MRWVVIGVVQGNSEVAWLLLQQGFAASDPDDCGNTCLHLASAGGHHDIVKCLLCSGVDLAAVNWYGNTAQALATQPATRTLLHSLTTATKCAATNVCTFVCVYLCVFCVMCIVSWPLRVCVIRFRPRGAIVLVLLLRTRVHRGSQLPTDCVWITGLRCVQAVAVLRVRTLSFPSTPAVHFTLPLYARCPCSQ